MGELATRRRRLMERWMRTGLHLSASEAVAATETLESGFTSKILDRFDEWLHWPDTCPHGNPIPRGGGATLDHDGIYLDQAQPGERVVVGRITEEAEADIQLLNRLEWEQILPGVCLTVLTVDREAGTVAARSGTGRRVVLRDEMAAVVWGKRTEPHAQSGA